MKALCFFFFHLHCISRITKGRYRDAPSIIIHNSAPVFSSPDAGKRRKPSLSFLLALVHNSPIIHPAFKEGTDLQGLKARKKNKQTRQSTSRDPNPERERERERSGAARRVRSGTHRRGRSALRRGRLRLWLAGSPLSPSLCLG